MPGRLPYVVLTALLLCAAPVFAGGEAPADVKAVLGKAGVPVFPGAVFCTGNTEVAFRFATKQPPEAVRKWYASQKPGWSLFDESKFDIWVLYEGPKKIGMMEWMNYNMVQVGKNDQLPSWHKLPKDMTTEIVLGVDNKYKKSK